MLRSVLTDVLGRTTYPDIGAGRPDIFDKYVDRDLKNPWDIEHSWAADPAPYRDQFATDSEFQE